MMQLTKQQQKDLRQYMRKCQDLNYKKSVFGLSQQQQKELQYAIARKKYLLSLLRMYNVE